MKIEKAEIFIVDLPLKASFTTSFGTISKRSSVLVKLTSDIGLIGWGEAAALPDPLYSNETVDTEILILRKYLIPLVIKRNFRSVKEFVDTYQFVKGHNFAKCGLESAFWCLWSLKTEKSLPLLLGGTRKKIPIGESIGIKKSTKDTLDEIDLRLKEGYRRIKIKVKPGWDVKLVKAIRQKFGDIPLMIDANSAYTLKDIKLFQELDKYKLLMIEQPLGDDDIIDHSKLQKQIKTPICLDESIISLDDARKAIDIGACKVINIKPGRVGGLFESIKVHNYCQKKGIPVWCGGMLESGIGRSFNIALSSLPGFSLPADMSPSSLFYERDIIDPTYSVDNNGYISVSSENGLGYEVDEDLIDQYCAKKHSFN